MNFSETIKSAQNTPQKRLKTMRGGTNTSDSGCDSINFTKSSL